MPSVGIAEVARQMRHKTPQTTLAIYAHSLSEATDSRYDAWLKKETQMIRPDCPGLAPNAARRSKALHTGFPRSNMFF